MKEQKGIKEQLNGEFCPNKCPGKCRTQIRVDESEYFTLEEAIAVSQPLGRCPVPGLSIRYTGPRKVLLEFVILVF